MTFLRLFSCVALLVAGGCIHTNDNCGNSPIVSPTRITNEVNDKDDPVLPPYTPWWVKE